MSTRKMSPEKSGIPEVSLADKPPWQRICERLRKRARFARWMSYFAIFIVLAVLGIGCLAIYHANDIVMGQWDSYGTYDASPRTYDYTSESWYEEPVAGSSNKPTKEDRVTKEIQALRYLQQTQQEELSKLTNEVGDMASEFQKKISALEGTVARVQQKVDSIADVPRLEREQWKNLVATFATRFGLAAVLLLMVRILVSVYRYHARLSAYYDSKADALELAPIGDVASFERLCAAITPTGIDFQESADSIAEHAVEIARKISPEKNE